MKRICLLIIILLVGMTSVYSNSMPVRWEEYPSLVMVSVDDATDIAVRKESLSFDFSHGAMEGFSFEGLVSAVYEMENTGRDDVISKMAFPFIGSIGENPAESIGLEADGELLDVEVFYGDDVDESEDLFAGLKAENILAQFQWDAFEPEHFRWNDQILCYTLQLDTPLEELDFQVDWENGENQTVFVSGFTGYRISEDGKVSVSSWVRSLGEVFEIYTIGEPLEFVFSAQVLSNETRQTTESFSVDIETEVLDVETFLVRYLEQSVSGRINEEEIRGNLDFYAREVDALLERSPNFVSPDDAMQIIEEDRFILMVYDVPFEGGQIRQVSATYPTMGTMDRSRTVSPTYTYQYLLSPAEKWKSFESLTVVIDPPEEAPYVIDSSIGLERLEDGTYSATLETLPEENLFFTLYEKERITIWERVKGFMNHQLLGFLILGVLLLTIVVGTIILRIGYKLIAGNRNK